MKMRVLVAAVAVAAVSIVACSGDGTYIFLAQQYEPSQDCVDNYSAVDVIGGDDPGALCSPVCLTNAGVYYITSECPPYPPDFTQEGLDGAVDSTCAAALAAFARTDLCVDGGPPTNPIDASPDTSTADASLDTAPDTSGGDATTD